MAAYLDELRDIPTALMSCGLRRLVRKGGEFAPALSAIRRECALVLRERHRAAQGLPPVAQGDINVELWIGRAGAPLPALPAEIDETPAPPELRERCDQMLTTLAERMTKR